MRVLGRLAMLTLAVTLLVGCAPETDFTARFLRYETQPDGGRVAVIQPTAQGADPGELLAYTKYTDLVPGEIVYATADGRDWDQPQYAPAASIVRRASPER